MSRAIQIAKLGSSVKSNPTVGAVLVYKDRIIGEGYHDTYGGPHAEVNCLNNVAAEHLPLICKSTLFVTLEPCCYTGKTGACTDLILKYQIPKVVIGILDPNPRVAGKGIQILENHGIEVTIGELELECKNLIRPFMANQKLRPYIILKWAMSHNNLIGIEDKTALISNNLSNIYSHDLRSNVDGILVGTNTINTDEPSLTTRHVKGSNPRRIILGSHTSTPDLKEYRKGDILIQLKEDAISKKYDVHIKLDPKDLSLLMKPLYDEGINRLLVEGGQKVLRSFIKSNLWDEAVIIQSSQSLSLSNSEKGIKAPLIHGALIYKYNLDDNSIIKLENTNF